MWVFNMTRGKAEVPTPDKARRTGHRLLNLNSPAAERQNGTTGDTMRMNRFVRLLLFAVSVLAISATSFAQIGVCRSRSARPLCRCRNKPPCPAPGYLWTPGYWAGLPRRRRLLLGAGYMGYGPGSRFPLDSPWWGRAGGVFAFHEGYWGPHVGFMAGWLRLRLFRPRL